MKKFMAAVAAGVVMVLLLATPAAASSSGLNGSLTRGQVTWYGTARTITASGSNIYVQKVDGPEIDVKWYKCSDRNVSGAWYRLPNADPTARIRIGTGFAPNTQFCLAALSYGSNTTDTWAGTVWWNVFS